MNLVALLRFAKMDPMFFKINVFIKKKKKGKIKDFLKHPTFFNLGTCDQIIQRTL